MSATVTSETITTSVPARLDRLPWSRFHWLIVIGLGTVWILDGLEVTIIGSVAPRLTQAGSGIHLTGADIGIAGGIYVAGACCGALFFGQLTDRLGRKKLFLITLLVYIIATVATAFSWTAWFFFLMRFITGAGIGGEYAAINSAIDELIPARVRGRVDLIINGTFWLGSAIGALTALLLLDEHIFAKDIGWRVAFVLGAVLGFGLLFVRRNVPESPRWLFIHGRQAEAERVVDEIEQRIQAETGLKLEPATSSITIRQRKSTSLREIITVAVKRYPRRTVLALALFVGQAFLYNAVTFDLGVLLKSKDFFGIGADQVPFFLALYAISNFLGPLTLGRLFDTVGRKTMITFTYVMSAVLTLGLAMLFMNDQLTLWGFIAVVLAVFFFASAGASAAYLTVSEIFPMETRAMAIAFFFAIGTAIGGISGPILFGALIATGNHEMVAIGFFIGAAVMLIGGMAELFFGINAEQQSLEEIAKPLSVEHAEADGVVGERARERSEDAHSIRERIAARRERERAGLRRYRPGPGLTFSSRGMLTSTQVAAAVEVDVDREVEIIVRALNETGAIHRDQLAKIIGAGYWGPGMFRSAIHQATVEGRIHRISRTIFAPVVEARKTAPEARTATPQRQVS